MELPEAGGKKGKAPDAKAAEAEAILSRRKPQDLIVAPVQTYDDILRDDQAWANDYLIKLQDPVRGEIKVVGFTVSLSGTPAANQGPPPELDQHTEAVLSEVGYSWERISELRAAGIVGLPAGDGQAAKAL